MMLTRTDLHVQSDIEEMKMMAVKRLNSKYIGAVEF